MATKNISSSKNYEFGGPWGAFFIILFSHFIVYYLWISLTYYKGTLFLPSSFEEIGPFFQKIQHYIITGASPNITAFCIFLGFLFIQFFFSRFLPGIHVKGLPIPSQNNKQLNYLCNGLISWYASLLLAGVLHFTGIFPLTMLADHLGGIITTAILFANGLALYLFIKAKITQNQFSPTHNSLYDFFIGVTLNPRFGKVDVKMFSEIRIPWILLFFLTLSAAAKQYQITGTLSSSMIFMIVAHGLYTNACMKGEECIPTTWDIFYEKFGWMLIFWNYVGVPFVYCFQSFYILQNNPYIPPGCMAFLFGILFIAYYVWDTANSQKNRFRMQMKGTFIQRKAFPQLPWGTLKNPRYITTATGSALLTDGWYKYGRKIHYTADTIMAITWGLSCGFGGILPYFYPMFFVIMIAHRNHRDIKRCEKKYGEDWELYCKKVPYRFIPYVY